METGEPERAQDGEQEEKLILEVTLDVEALSQLTQALQEVENACVSSSWQV